MVHGVLDPNSVAAQLGLERDPFPDTPDGLFLNTPPLAQRIQLLSWLLGTSTRPVLVCGPRGCGMTTLLHSAAATLGSPYQCMVWTAFTQSTTQDLLSDLLVRLSPDDEPLPEDEVELADAVRTQLIRLQAAAAIPVLLIDEADNLADAVLQTLLDLGDTTAGWLRLVLGGSEDIEQQVLAKREATDHLWLPRIEMPRMDAKEVADYLHLRMVQSGWTGTPPFNQQASSELHIASDGRPARLNELAVHALEAMLPNPEPPNWRERMKLPSLKLPPLSLPSLPRLVVPSTQFRLSLPSMPSLPLPRPLSASPWVPITISVAVVLVMAFAWFLLSSSWFETDPDAVVVHDPSTGKTTQVGTFELPDSLVDQRSVDALNQRDSQPPPVNTQTGDAPVSLPDPVVTAPSLQAEAVEQPVSTAETSQPASDDVPQSLPRPPAKPQLVAQSEAVAGPETSAESQTTSASIENQTRLTLAPPPRPRAPSRDRVIERQPRPAPAPATQATPSTIQTDGRFGLQFVAFAEFSRARAYILQNELKGDTLIYRLPEGSGGALFAVIKGSYPDRDSANAAIVGLSRTLRATGPWPRELTGLRPIRP